LLNLDKEFNIIITTPRNREWYAIEEIESIIYYLKIECKYDFWRSGISGVVLGYIDYPVREFIGKLKSLLSERPWEFRDIKRVIPVDVIVDTDYTEISRVSWRIAENIPKGATFRINVKKRYTELSSRELIRVVAEGIDRKVDLENPDYIINIEILGPKTGVALIKPDDILSVEKELLR